ncbi:cupin domain-containing protein [Niveibacterium sp. SC-1]|uniref:cupin domain-containing protein n=1 Tax=Niveibacterium sp. SC-1 TaxID=3135646 RepID=UPI00311E47F4
MIQTLLGGLSARDFLAQYWQKKPLLVRGAIPDFQGVFDRASLLDLACDEDVESRMVWHQNDAWQLARGPFRPSDFKRRRDAWSVLVSGANLMSEPADALLRRFSFIPQARLDDLMVSYATPGGGVGPHFDSYDVFLLQGAGVRRWQIGKQRDLSLIEGAPLRILRDFRPSHEWDLQPGDMLYLPPRYAHNGIALSDCMTYSIGFRAPATQELAEGFLSFLQEELELKGRYADPDLKLARHPAALPEDMIDQVSEMLARIRWGRADVARFLGRYLSEPKAHVFFDPPERPLTEKAFVTACTRRGFALDLKTQLLFRGKQLYLNGEVEDPPSSLLKRLQKLADLRCLAGSDLDPEICSYLFVWYNAGFGMPSKGGKDF